MRVKLFAAALSSVLALFMVGCQPKEPEFAIENLAAELEIKIEYDDELAPLDSDMASNFVDFNGVGVDESIFYEGSGGTAEEIVVVKCSSKEDAAKAVIALGTRVEEQKNVFKDYAPDEMPKLESAVIVANGKYAVLSVSKDSDTAKTIINGYMK